MSRIPSAAALLLLTLPVSHALAEDPKPVEQFQARAVSLGTANSQPIEIAVERWSTDAEQEMLLKTLRDSGRENLANALMKVQPRVGYMRAPFWPAEVKGDLDLFYARENPTSDGGRDVVLATSRHVTFDKAANQTRSTQYEVTVIEIRLDKDGKGEGKMVPAAKVTWDAAGKKIEIENYSELPVYLFKETAKKG
jgi:hypothetical protein